MRQFGELVGLAFQIKDDIFDYGMPGTIGKPTGNDIRERKITLPLIYALEHSDKATRKELMNIVKRHNEDKEYVHKAIQIVRNAGGIEYSHQRMLELKSQALDLLTDIPDSPAKRSLIGLVEYTVSREK
jgi:octaprenyl-diphosphate synthase